MLDTWFSSALWPFATLGWPDETPELRAFYPTDVLSTARDILFLWVARMVMMGLRFTGEIPFSDVYVHSIIQAPDGRRMSKSLGTGIDPLDLIDGGPRPPVFAEGAGDFPAYGADAVRFGLLAMSSTQDVRFSEEKIAAGPGARQQALQRDALRRAAGRRGRRAPSRCRAPSRTAGSSRACRRSRPTRAARIDGFDFAKAALGLYDFVYGELCDWYLELVKPRLGDDADPDDRAALGATLLHVLRETIATAHPIIPFVTEELWELLGYTAAEGLLAAGRLPAARRRAARPRRRGSRWAARSRRSRRCARGATRSASRPGAIVPGVLRATRLRADGGARRRPRALRRSPPTTRTAPQPVATIAIPGGAVDVLASRRRRPRRGRAPPRAGARDARARDRAGDAASSPTRASSPRRRRRSSRPSATSSSACARSWRRCARAGT